MAEITVLRPVEGLRLDPERLANLYVELGEARAQAMIARAMDDLSFSMGQIYLETDSNRLRALCHLSRRICDIAEPLGLHGLALVANDVAVTARRGDRIALGAVLSRLGRLADRCLKMAVDLQDRSG